MSAFVFFLLFVQSILGCLTPRLQITVCRFLDVSVDVEVLKVSSILKIVPFFLVLSNRWEKCNWTSTAPQFTPNCFGLVLKSFCRFPLHEKLNRCCKIDTQRNRYNCRWLWVHVQVPIVTDWTHIIKDAQVLTPNTSCSVVDFPMSLLLCWRRKGLFDFLPVEKYESASNTCAREKQICS